MLPASRIATFANVRRSAVSTASKAAFSSGPARMNPASGQTVGVVGLGNMGSGVVHNLLEAGNNVVVYDASEAARSQFPPEVTVASSAKDVAQKASTVISVLPNDKVLHAVTHDPDTGLLAGMGEGSLHISVSTVSPQTSRELASAHGEKGASFVGAPIFARPDGVRAKQGAFVVGGEEKAVEAATPVLQTTCDVWHFGADPGAGNVVKLCGNFLIAATIESLAEALALAENNGADRVAVKDMLTATIFNCLIYNGYGQRVADRDHRPGGFALELGLKDVTLVKEVAHASNTPMPFASALQDRFLSARALGLADFDWSAIGLLASESAGVDISEARATNQAAVDAEAAEAKKKKSE